MDSKSAIHPMNSPLVSVITVTFNAQRYIEQTIQSVLAQTYPDTEYIIIDGGSTDGTTDIIHRYAGHLSYWVSEKDNGIYDAMNKGIRHAKGQLIGMVNAGDFYEPDTVQRVVDAYMQHPDCGVFHGDINMLNEDGSLFKQKHANTDLQQLDKGFGLFHPTFFIPKAVYEKIGLYDTDFRLAADYDFALRCRNAAVPFCHIPYILSNFRIGGATNRQRRRSIEESKRALLKNGVPAQTAGQAYRQWLRQMRKDIVLRRIYDILRKIFPQQLIHRISLRIHI